MTTVEQVQFWAQTDVGRVRDHNEDSYLADRTLNVYAVADGMGGHAAGEVASSMAVQTIRDYLSLHRDTLEKVRHLRQESPERDEVRDEFRGVLDEAFNRASRAIWEKAQTDESKRGMGTTLSVLVLGDSLGFIAHVGDSRIYLIRNAQVVQLTTDHTLANEIKEGRVTLAEGQVVSKNAITRAVGVYEAVEVQIEMFPVVAGDQFLLASDGLTGYLEEAELPPYLQSPDIKAIPSKLIDLANNRGGKDNITSVFVRIVDIEGQAKERIHDLNFRLETLNKMPFFKYLSYSDLLKVFVTMQNVRVAADTLVFEKGDAGADLFIVLSGKVRVHLGVTELATLGPGAHFGEQALIDQAPRSASITAVEDTLLLRLERQQFFGIIRKENELAKKILWNILQVLSGRLRSTSQELESVRQSLIEEIPIDAVEVFGK